VKADRSMSLSVNFIELLAGESKACRANLVEVGEYLEMEFGWEIGEVLWTTNCSGLGFMGY
jgi:hypothetical protein